MGNAEWVDKNRELTREQVEEIVSAEKEKSRLIDLSYTVLNGLDLRGLNLSGVNFHRASLIKANLSDVELNGANLFEAYLIEADLNGAKLNGANLSYARLANASLRKAELFNANFSWADLAGADLSWADLTGAIFRGTNLNEADLFASNVGFTIFGGVDLRAVSNLDEVKHDLPSIIGIDTIYNSKGNISQSFLRGTGIPDNFIAFLDSLTATAFELYTCFISYSSRDENFARQLYEDLQQNGVRCWYSSENLRIGDGIRSSIDKAIKIYDRLLIILSENSINSAWVEKEVETAFEEERKRQETILLPIRLDDAVMNTEKAWAADIRRARYIGDFTKWEERDEYAKAFEQLIGVLKARE